MREVLPQHLARFYAPGRWGRRWNAARRGDRTTPPCKLSSRVPGGQPTVAPPLPIPPPPEKSRRAVRGVRVAAASPCVPAIFVDPHGPPPAWRSCSINSRTRALRRPALVRSFLPSFVRSFVPSFLRPFGSRREDLRGSKSAFVHAAACPPRQTAEAKADGKRTEGCCCHRLRVAPGRGVGKRAGLGRSIASQRPAVCIAITTRTTETSPRRVVSPSPTQAGTVEERPR